MEILESIVWVSIGFVSMFAAMELAWRQARRIESGEHIKGRLAITEIKVYISSCDYSRIISLRNILAV
jgi:hypothetical protein